MTTSMIAERTQPHWSSAAAKRHGCPAWALEYARESSRRYPIRFDATRDNFKLGHIFLRDRGYHTAVYCETQVLRTVEKLSFREPSDTELVIYNVLTAVDSLTAISGVG
ncbi:hypothetical protein [Paraburkholderia sp. 40]|uniref:hypothetical protein n=1 Tax=Paraburkholderia sp. 40 TaxID=2991059 RepID=UPI003D1F3793